MKLTQILYVRSWIAKLHPPMPPTSQENKQLLSLLTSSFQGRLDDAHPPIEPVDPVPQTILPASGAVTDNRSARATMDHLQSLLQHPLLAQNRLNQTKSQSAAAQAARMMDEAMLHGEVDLEMVNRCMQVYVKTLQNGNMVIKDEFRLGRRILAWFTSSNAATKEIFLHSPDVLRNAVPILYADGLEDAVWEWLGILYNRKIGVGGLQDAPKPVQWVRQESHLTFFMIKEALRRRKLDAAVLQLVQACAYMRCTGRVSSEALSSPPWQAATQAVTIALLGRRDQHGLSAHLFDCFLEQRSMWAEPTTFTFELMSLYHPTRPSAKPLAMAFERTNGQFQGHFDQLKTRTEPAQKIILNALLDGAQLLLKKEPSSVQKARLILDIVQEQFPDPPDSQHNDAPQKRIQSIRQAAFISPPFMSAPIGVT